MKIRFAILTVSTRASGGIYQDESGNVLREMISALDAEIRVQELIPDDKDLIRQKLITYCDTLEVDVVLTTGGTGFSPTDVTPEATQQVIDRPAPGIAEALRAESSRKTPLGMLSRGIAGIRRSTLIVNLPGSPSGAKENFGYLLKILPHAVELLQGKESKHP